MHPKACWILCVPRTGSSVLCELLNNLGSFPIYHHENMKKNRGPLEVGQTFNEWSRLFENVYQFLENPPPYSKMIFHQYVETMVGIPKKTRYNVGWYPDKYEKDLMAGAAVKYNSKFARSVFPDLRFLKLNRDPISHAISLYFARTTKTYHIYDKRNLDKYMSTVVDVDLSKLLEAYHDALDYADSWNDFLCGDEIILNVEYHDLISDTRATMEKIMDFLGVKGDLDASMEKVYGNNPRIFRMTRPEASDLEKKLRSLLKIKLL